MSTYSPSPAFQNAASYLSNVSSLSNISTAIKLELYGLYKYLTVSPKPNTSQPSLFYIQERAKWDAWSAAGKTHEDRGVEAEKRYLEIARDLGWTEGFPTIPGFAEQSHMQSEKTTGFSEDDWDDESSGLGSNHGGNAGGGMAASVSAMAPPPLDKQDAKSLHGLALLNNIPDLTSYLEAHPGVDINEFDQHGYTALHLACDRGNTAIVELLLRRGADCSLQDSDDFTALELANVAGHDDIVALIEKAHKEGKFIVDTA